MIDDVVRFGVAWCSESVAVWGVVIKEETNVKINLTTHSPYH